MLTLIQSGVHVKRKVVLMIERQAAEEIQMVRRHTARNREPRVIKFRIPAGRQRSSGILLKSSLAAGHRCDPDVGRALDKIEQHLLVITTQANNAIGILTAKLENLIDTARRIEPAIDQIAEKHQRVYGAVARQHLEQIRKLRAATMNVS